MDSMKVSGNLYVLLDRDLSGEDKPVGDRSSDVSNDLSRLLERLEDEVDFLRRELERKDAILLRMAERMPELEAPQDTPLEPRGSPETGSEHVDRPEPPDTGRRSWWRRVFGFE